MRSRLFLTRSCLVALVLAGGGGAPPAASKAPADGAALSPDVAKKLFEKFKAMEGDWVGKSTKGWTERITYKTIAGGSCVLETSFDAHPNEMMVTMICPDAERLLLTHYCVAKNQPRLLATAWDESSQTATFSFLDGTNMPSRDRGHMDKVVFKFVDADHFTSRWTWYQDGKESWMEEILHRRLKPGEKVEPAADEGATK